MGDVSLRYRGDSAPSQKPVRLADPYLMIVEQQLPLYRDETEQLFAGDPWHKDLLMYFEFLDHLMLESPRYQQEPHRDAKPLFVDESQF